MVKLSFLRSIFDTLASASPTVSAAVEVEESEILAQAVKLQVPFIENAGQVENEAVRFYARTFGGTVFVEDGGVLTYTLPARNGRGDT